VRWATTARRFLTPPFIVSLLCWWRWGAKVSPRSEVELSSNLSFGNGCVISSFCKIKTSDGELRLGDYVQIASHCFLSAGPAGIAIGEHTMIGPMATLVSSNYSYERLDEPISLQAKTSRGIRIGHGVWIGSGVVVLDGSEIGDNVIVTPNSVVSGRVAANAVVQGSPARVIFMRR
jgi:acetyltransferase-like isoleucine patch superfamily enzyme